MLFTRTTPRSRVLHSLELVPPPRVMPSAPDDLCPAPARRRVGAYVDAGGRPYPKRLVLTSSRLEQTGFQMPSLHDAIERMHDALPRS